MLDKFRIRLAGLGPVFLRVALGTVFVVHGWPKLQQLFAGKNPVGQLVADWPIPELWGWAAGLTEFVGGIFLLLGLLTRFWSAGAVIQMSVATFAVHWGTFHLKEGGFEYAFTLGLIGLALFVMGPGPISLDYLLGRLIRGERANQVIGATLPPPERPAGDEPPQRPSAPPQPQHRTAEPG